MANKNFRVKHGLEVAGSATVENDLTVTGNLTVNGTTTTLNTATLAVEDNIVVLNSGVTGTPSLDAGIEVERGDSTNSALTWDEDTDKWYQDRAGVSTVIPVSTSELAESGNLYYTDVRARAAISGGTGVSYNSGTGVIAIGQAVGTTSNVTFGTVDANITDDNYVLGQLYLTRNTSYVPPTSPLTTVSGTNGIVVSSSSGGAAGYNAGVTLRYHIGDTTAGAFSAASITQSVAGGTNMAPSGISTNAVMGTTNWDGYTAGTSNNYANQIASANQGAGVNAITPLQAQAYARQAFTNSTTVTTAVTGASGTGSVATLTFTTQNTAPYAVGQTVTVAGMTPSGYNGTVVITAATTSSISYANTTTGFTSGGTIAAANTVTAAGTGFRIRGFANSTPMTTGNRFNFMDLTASAATFKSDAYTFANSVITGSTLTATNYMTLSATTGIINQDTILLRNTAGTTTYATLNSTSASFNGDAINLRNTAGTTTYATFQSAQASITATGPTTIQRIATAGGANPSLLLTRQNTSTATPIDNDGTGLRISTLGTSGTNYGIGFFNYLYQTPASGSDHEFVLALAKGDQTGNVVDSVTTISSKPTNTRIFAGTAGAAGATTVKLTVDTNKITAAVPVAFPVYTAAQANALTGAVGWQICISDSGGGGNPNGMMAFWDTTNARWSYIHDNTAV